MRFILVLLFVLGPLGPVNAKIMKPLTPEEQRVILHKGTERRLFFYQFRLPFFVQVRFLLCLAQFRR